MALLVELHPSPAPRTPALRPVPVEVYPVPEGGVLHFPGARAGVPAPAQLGPLMSPPAVGVTVFGR